MRFWVIALAMPSSSPAGEILSFTVLSVAGPAADLSLSSVLCGASPKGRSGRCGLVWRRVKRDRRAGVILEGSTSLHAQRGKALQ